MDNEKTVLGYIVCHDCMTPKAIYQGSGKRIKYVYGRCTCGMDNRTGKSAQEKMSTFKPLEDVQAEIEAIKANKLAKQTQSEPQSKDNNEPQPQGNQPQSVVIPDSESKPIGAATCVGIGAFLGFLCGGIIKTIRAVA